MNTILTILLLIALIINIVCDIVRLWTFQRTVDESKQNVKETICKAVEKATMDWCHCDSHDRFTKFFRDNFEKYL